MLKINIQENTIAVDKPKDYPRLLKGSKGTIIEVLEKYSLAASIIVRHCPNKNFRLGFHSSFMLNGRSAIEIFEEDFNGVLTIENLK